MLKGYEVTILTTTSKDHLKWDHSYQAGEEQIDGIKVMRFKPRFPRYAALVRCLKIAIHIATCLHLHQSIKRVLSRLFILTQGPVIPDLSEYLRSQSESLNIFYCYLYYPAVESSKACSDFVLIPTAHDEFTLYLEGVKDLMKRASLILLQTNAERDLIERNFLNHGTLKVGAFGFNLPEQLKFAHSHVSIPDQDPYLFFAGRIGPGKNIPLLISQLIKINRNRAKPYKLYLAGSIERNYKLPKLPWLEYLGLIPDQLKFNYMAGALAVINPSSLESLSILALEALMMGRPLIVNQACEVLTEYSSWSHLCLVFNDLDSLDAALAKANELLKAKNFGEIGLKTQAEVLSRFNWDTTTEIINQYAKTLRHQ